MAQAEHLLYFYGDGCEHCEEMHPAIEKLEKELGIELKKLEVWNNAENDKIWKSYDKGLCGGVPFFFNTKTKKYICGEAEYDQLKDWATGK